MFKDIGVKIKDLARFLSVVGIVASIIFGIGIFQNVNAGTGMLVIICGPIVSWISSWLLFGFGELVDNTTLIAKKLYQQQPDTGLVTDQTQASSTMDSVNNQKSST